MVGCRHGAKNTLVKNYLWFAEKLGVEILPERQVTEIRPLGAADGSDGYAVTSERSGRLAAQAPAQTLTARGVVIAAGALGTNQLLANCKHGGSLPRLSDRLGDLVRTNSRVDPGGDRARRRAATSAARSRSPRASTPIPTPTSRSSPTASAGDAMSFTVHADDRADGRA